MLSGPVAKSESRFDSKLSTLSEEKDTDSRASCVWLGKAGTESNGFWRQDFDASTEFRHSAFSRAVSAVWPFEVRPRSHLPRQPWGLQNLRPLAIIGRPHYFHGHTM